MPKTQPKRLPDLRGLLFGLWLGPILGAILITMMQPFFFGGDLSLDFGAIIRNAAVYVYPLSAVVGFPFVLLLVRHEWMHFGGFVFAGAGAGVIVTCLYLLAQHFLDLLPSANTSSTMYVFCSAFVAAFSVWAVTGVAGHFYGKDGDGS